MVHFTGLKPGGAVCPYAQSLCMVNTDECHSLGRSAKEKRGWPTFSVLFQLLSIILTICLQAGVHSHALIHKCIYRIAHKNMYE